MSKGPRVDLTLLKRLVAELESALTASESLKDDSSKENKEATNDYVVEMSKCAGLAAGVMAESTLLVGDIQTAIQLAQGPGSSKSDPLTKLLGSLKGGGGLTGSN